ncbi:glucose-6-phosphate isomerase [Methylocapsa palsarum]|uniref:Glucose-6-phosphate isomerase n=1 Tax=Methylocapsa palsarum TaxID=1612308 RepID=A0A1I3YNV5_9HYPH|nr:glucose-6-phosphate isomerase [Methylocapsa palsarum]SFK33460.1 glucose-6-phosphate isomerase [Methylocapsa palsarum]
MARDEVAEALSALEAHKREIGAVKISKFFQDDPERFARFHIALDDLIFDFSKHRLTEKTFALLLDLARSARVEARRAALFAGEAVNATERRPALHMALRNLSGKPMFAEGVDVMPDVVAERGKMEAFAEAIRSGSIKAANGERFTDIVNFGIGGSDLGPKMAAQALAPFVADHLTLHFVANVDGADIGDTLKRLPLSTTLFVICSKTFTTLETMTNARTARDRVARTLGEKAVADHFCAVSTHLDKIAEFGVRSDRVFGFWDWVGGRYSIWSSIGLSLAIGIGARQFQEFLRGGEDIDTHFLEAPLERNIPVIMALLGVWYRDFWGFSTLAIIPYDERLGRFPAYIQQLDMESNGKSVDLSGAPVTMATAPIIFGEPGTNCQHAFFQLFHQGQTIVPVDFLIAAEPTCADPAHHQLLLANCLAQSQALMQGRALDEVVLRLQAEGLSSEAAVALAPHKAFAGDRPSSTLLYKQLTPRALGRLIALYEHKVFVQGVIWNINSFDQWGVELGKELAIELAPIIADGARSTRGLDPSTAGLIEAARLLAKTEV